MSVLRTLWEPCSSRAAALIARNGCSQRTFCSSVARKEKKAEQPQTAASDNIELSAVCLRLPFLSASKRGASEIQRKITERRTDDSLQCISPNPTIHGSTYPMKTGQLHPPILGAIADRKAVEKYSAQSTCSVPLPKFSVCSRWPQSGQLTCSHSRRSS
jgi:hypothetical protein